MLRRTLLDALLFQCCWFACVLGANLGALLATCLILPLHAWLVPQGTRRWLCAAAMACAGLLLDSTWHATGVLRFQAVLPGGLPAWLAPVWLMLGLSLFESLSWLQKRIWLAALMGAICGPLAYLAGTRLGAAQLGLPSSQVAMLLAAAWSVLLPVFARIALVPSEAPATALARQS